MTTTSGDKSNGDATKADNALAHAPTDVLLSGGEIAQAAEPEFAGDDPLIGTRVAGYRILEQLDRGGMGVVYRALQESLGRTVVIKVLAPGLTAVTSAVARFAREAQLCAQVSHPNVVAIFEMGALPDGRYFIAMEYLEGEPLSAMIARYGNSGTMIPLGQAVNIARQIGSGMAAVHATGVLHRDLKPDNIMILPDGAVKVVDFGLAVLCDAVGDRLTSVGTALGTPAYMAPEQYDPGITDARSDIYALGAVLYEMLTFRPPHFETSATRLLHQKLRADPERVSSLRREVSFALEELAMTMLSRDPARRPQSMDEVRDRLTAMMTGETALSSAPQRPMAPMPDVRLIAGAALAVAILVAGVLAMLFSADREAVQAIAPETPAVVEDPNLPAQAGPDLSRGERGLSEMENQDQAEPADAVAPDAQSAPASVDQRDPVRARKVGTVARRTRKAAAPPKPRPGKAVVIEADPLAPPADELGGEPVRLKVK